MTHKKIINIFLFGFLALLGFSNVVRAANSASLTCDDTEIKVGESTNCTVNITSEDALSAASITLTTSEYLDISNIKAATSAGWAVDSQASGVYKFKAINTSSGVAAGRTQVFSFTLTLNDKAKNLSAEDSCGQLCISAAAFTTFGGEALTIPITTGTGTCFSPTVELCTGSGCEPAPNPNTGEFANYLVLGLTAFIALIAILVARRGNKFYSM